VLQKEDQRVEAAVFKNTNAFLISYKDHMNHVLKDMLRWKKNLMQSEGSVRNQGELSKVTEQAAKFK